MLANNILNSNKQIPYGFRLSGEGDVHASEISERLYTGFGGGGRLHCLKSKGMKFKLALHKLYMTHLKASDRIKYCNSLLSLKLG